MTAPRVRVIKLGGSLLDWPRLQDSFNVWLAQQSPAHHVMVVGGGEVVEHLRKLDQLHKLESEATHWLAIRGMSLTAAMASCIFPDAVLVKSHADLQLAGEPTGNTVQILEVESLLRADCGDPEALPCGWHVTSDSIAARVARLLEAGELVLLKSALPTSAIDRERLAREGLVDEYFPIASRGLQVRIVDLRSGQSCSIARQ